MADHFDDDPSFWGEQPTRRLQRPAVSKRAEFERTREHKVVPRRAAATAPAFYDQARYADADSADADEQAWEDFGAQDVEPWIAEPQGGRSSLGVDPRLMRAGALAAAAVLLVPVVLAVTADDGGSGDEVRTEERASTVVTTLAPQSESTVQPGVIEITAAVRPVPAGEEAEASDDDTAAVAAETLTETGSTGDAADEESTSTAAAEPVTMAEPECAGTYTVVVGDYWLRFVESSGATLEEWLAANDAEPETQMYEGDELCIPAGAQAPSAATADTEPPESAPDETVAPDTTAAPAPSPEATTPPTSASAPDTTAAAPAPEATAPARTPPPTPAPTVPQGAPSTEGVCGALPTQNGSTTAGPAEVEAIIREIWPDDIEVRALCIAKREANLRPDLNNWCCYGVFAIYFGELPSDLRQQFGIDQPSDLWDARTNIALAYQIYLRGGWDPWSQTDPGSG
ncbi:MAG: hypothetical protein ACRDZ2_06865 [Ilumatobacteraceae bacterium]